MKRLSMLACGFLLAFSSQAFAGGNELMYKQVQNLATVTSAAVDGTNDYVPVYQASSGVVKKVAAGAVSSARAPTALAVDTTLDSTYCGKTVVFGGAGTSRTATLPAATGSGCRIRFYVGAVNTSNYVIARAGSDVLKGLVTIENTSNAVLGFHSATAVTCTLNGTTKGGGAIGDWVEAYDSASATWMIAGQLTSTGSAATCFA